VLSELTSFVKRQTLPEEDAPVDGELRSGSFDGSGNLLVMDDDSLNSTRVLSTGSDLTVAYAIHAKLKSGFRRGGVSSYLGILEVDWSPAAIHLSDDVMLSSITSVGSIESHGPLVLQSPCTMRFRAPACYNERAPFEARVERIPPTPLVASPFDVCYGHVNKTSLHQLLTIQLKAPVLTDGTCTLVDGLLVCGV
jgi:hypothetical protein